MRTVHATGPFAPKSPRQRAASCLLVLVLAFFSMPHIALSQTAPTERVQVPTSGANVHMSAGSGSELLVVVPKGTVLTVVGRDKEWIQVQLTPELRKTGMVFRWYKNEDKGWMHDSTVEVVKPQTGSPFYDNLRENLGNGEYVPLLFSREAVEKRAAHRLNLRPGPSVTLWSTRTPRID